MLICEDLWHLSAAAIMQAEEVDLLICLANSPARASRPNRSARPRSTATSAARTPCCWERSWSWSTASDSRTGCASGAAAWSWDRAGTSWPRPRMLDEALTIAVFDLAELRRQRLITPLGRDERLLLTLEELQRIKRRRYEH